METGVRPSMDAWLADPAIAEEDKEEVRRLQRAGDEKDLTDRFYRDLEFGTGGMRGIIGAGRNRMNVYTVGAAAQGLANYISKQGEAAKKAGAVFAYDSRHWSDLFAERVACVLAANGITAYLFEKLRSTPELSFAVRHLGCTAGGVVTASHNPPQYNGFKVYWSDGVQVVPPHDEAIMREVQKVGAFSNVKLMDAAEAKARGLIKMIGREVDEAFLDCVQKSCLSPDISKRVGKNLKIVYTPLHGAGCPLIPEALLRRGFEQVIVVPQQGEPDGNFPTVEYPNPEEGAALKLGIELARKEGADLVIATDPDVDRVGIAVRAPVGTGATRPGSDSGDFVLLTGNQIASLLTYYICDTLAQRHALPKDAVLITSIVSGDMMKTIARSYRVEVIEVLTGFKWIGQKVAQFEAAKRAGRPSKTYIFGAEESYGYMPAVYTADKDGITSTAYIADMAAAAAAKGSNLYAWLEELFGKFGFYQEGVKNLTLPGKDGADKIVGIMARLRQEPPRSIGGQPVRTMGDLKTGQIRDAAGGREVGRYDLPASNVLVFVLADGSKVIARPSGTEPKIKFYVLTHSQAADLAQARCEAQARIDAILADVTRWAE